MVNDFRQGRTAPEIRHLRSADGLRAPPDLLVRAPAFTIKQAPSQMARGPSPRSKTPRTAPPETGTMTRLLDIMARLRDPETGCPWDVEQNFSTIAPYTIEEAYEVADAIERDDMDGLKDELGDLLLQVVFHAQMAREAGHFGFADVAEAVSDKMVRRHPHVFGDRTVGSAAAQTAAWEEHKAEERRARAGNGEAPHPLDGLPLPLPSLSRAEKLGKRAARTGFDWPDAAPVAAKVEEELAEVRAEMIGDDGGEAARDRMEHEIGDLLFACAQLARHLAIDPETALRRANIRFEWRYRAMEAHLRDQGKTVEGTPIDDLEAAWQRAKALEEARGSVKESA